jgi:sugar/nucleoside kinase (ribokinase family)
VTLPPRDTKAVDVVCVGEISLDFVAVIDQFPTPDSKVTAHAFAAMPGGQAATAAVVCARQGWRARCVGCLGNDAWADTIAAHLAREGVTLSAIRREGARSRTAVVLVERGTGRRTIVEHRDPQQRLRIEDIAPEVATAGRVLLVDASDVDAATVAARAARAAAIPTIVDVDRVGPGVESLLAEIDIMIVPASFACAFASISDPAAALDRLVERFRPAAAVVTLGAEGSIARSHDREVRTPAPPITVVDTTGAGDAFRGGFIAAWLRFGAGGDFGRLLQYANATAALNCGALGAQGGVPDLSLVDALVTRTYGGQSK